MRQEKRFEEWLERAFRLAFFLHGDRETAKRIALEAMNKLETASNAQFKRFYYTPTGRAENGRAARRRVSLDDLQLLQRLVFVESEKFERARESSENVDEKSLLKFFIKHLVRIALKRNSFYVTLAVSRILHNYGTADAMEIYNVVVQDPERVHDDYYYRSRKGVLMKELKRRFEDLIEIVKVNRGEERFRALEKTEKDLTATAKNSLEFFTPWNSSCALPERFDPFSDIVKPFYFDKTDPDEEHKIEINRIHAAIHPECFSRLTAALDLPAPEEKMEIPKFMINTGHTDLDEDWRNPPRLDADELRQMKEFLAAQAESRKAMSGGFLRVVVDGAENARLDAEAGRSVNLTLDETAEVIELYGENETLLATHLLNFAELQKGARKEIFELADGEKIAFDLEPVFDGYGEVAGINFSVGYEEKTSGSVALPFFEKAKNAFSNLFAPRFLKPALSFGLIILALFFGWFVFRSSDPENKQIVVNPEPQDLNIEITPPEVAPEDEDRKAPENDSPAPKELKSPDAVPPARKEKSVEKNERKPTPEIKNDPAPKKEKAPKKETPGIETPQKHLFAADKNKRRRKEPDDDKVLRLPIRETGITIPGDNRFEIRGNKKFRGKSLNEVKNIYIEITGDLILGKQIAEQTAGEIGSSGRFKTVADKETADAALKLYVRHESDVDAPDEKMVTVIARLVNAEGFVIYPDRKGISGWKYVGELRRLPKRIAADLRAAQ
jgi:Periplasmic protein TonB, links inner and outer membranes